MAREGDSKGKRKGGSKYAIPLRVNLGSLHIEGVAGGSGQSSRSSISEPGRYVDKRLRQVGKYERCRKAVNLDESAKGVGCQKKERRAGNVIGDGW
jgi:hypothetical protein